MKKPLARGDVISITWVDIYEDPVGNPDTAKPAERVSLGRFWAQEERGGVSCLITSTTIDPDGPAQQGYCVYPMGCVVKIDIIKRHR